MEPDPTISRRSPTSRTDNKLILHCQACHHRALVDVKVDGVTDWICVNPDCLTTNRVTSERKQRQGWIDELARKAGLRK